MSYFRVEKSGQEHRNDCWLLKRFTICCLIIANHCIWAEQHPAEEDGPLSEVQTAVNLEVALPCDLTPGSMTSDKVQLVIWYKQGSIKPIYTFDARGRQLQQAIPWADEFVLKNKAQFFYDTNPPSLRIKNVQISDAGLYKCRVDFHKSPTRNWRINVTVLVPPTKLTILDTYGAAIRNNFAGPYIEGENINLTCLSSGGVPPPKVSWWKEHALADDSYQILPDGTVRNVLHLYNISRTDLLSVYTCQASNGHIVAALSGKVKLEMRLPPLNIFLQGLNHPLVAGVSTHVTCTSIGARPPPDIVWKKGGLTMRGATQSTSSDGNSTVSELVFIPAPEDNEKEVACFVAKTLPQQQDTGFRSTSLGSFNDNSFGGIELFLKDSRILNVTHAPIVSLDLGAPLDANNLMSGSDVYLECSIIANPLIMRIEWYHNDKKLHSARGILISNQTLVLQSISKISHGKYFCLATNIQGSVSSNEVYLDVKYPPICKSESTVIRAAIKQTINITCLVDSNPLNNLKYKWQFNNSLDNVIELPISSNQFFQAPSSLPLKAAMPTSGHHHNHYNYYQEFQKHPHHHKRLLQKFILQKQHQQSSIVPIDVHGRIHIPESVLAHSLQSSLFASNAKDSINIDSHLSYATVTSQNGSKTHNNNLHNVNHNDYNLIRNQERYDNNPEEESNGYPLAQMLYSNMVYTNQLDKTHRVHNENSKRIKMENDGRKMANLAGASLYEHNSDMRTSGMLQFHNVYQYNIESYESFGAVSCVASNQMGQSQPCWYHIQPADLPDPVKNCTTHNATSSSVQVHCIPGYDGGIQQHFHVQVYDELNRQILYNVTYKHSEFKIKSLPSDSVFVLRITSINLQGSSKLVYRLRARTLSVPLLRTASSTAVLVQLTPLLGALMGLIATLILVVICIVIFIKFRKKHIYRSNGNAAETADKGSVELLSRNLGSRSSLEDKNPDVVPLENSEDEFHAEEEAFDRLNMESYRVLCTQPTRRNPTSSPPPLLPSLSPKHKGEISLTTNPSYNVCNTPQQMRKPVYTAPPPLLSSKTPSNIYTRIPGRTYSPAFETRTPPTSPYGSLTICTMPLLGQNQPSHLQSLQVQRHQLHHPNLQQHPMTNENVMFSNYNMSP